MCKKGHIAWNKGLTKETNDSVMAISIGQMGNKSRTGMTNNPEMRAKISKSMMGKKYGLGNKSRIGQKRSKEEISKQVIMYKSKGYKLDEERKAKLIAGAVGHVVTKEMRESIANANRNRLWTDDARRRISLKSREWWSNTENAQSLIHKLRVASGVKPNKLESKVIDILGKYLGNEWKYVGDGSLIIGRYCPDFVRNHGHNQIIEIYGDYWHRGENPQDRIDLFDSFGYKTLVLWESEVHKMSEDEFVKCVIDFMNTADLFYYKPKINVVGEQEK